MHTFTKAITFAPLSNGRYRCNQTGRIVTQAQILSYVYQYITQGNSDPTPLRVSPSSPRKNTSSNRASKYRSKHK